MSTLSVMYRKSWIRVLSMIVLGYVVIASFYVSSNKNLTIEEIVPTDDNYCYILGVTENGIKYSYKEHPSSCSYLEIGSTVICGMNSKCHNLNRMYK